MAGLCAVSVSANAPKSCLEDLFWLTSYLQHLGEKYCGMATREDGGISSTTERGLFRPNIAGKLDRLSGKDGIGYCGLFAEPYRRWSKFGEWCLCFDGNIINISDLREGFTRKGELFEKGSEEGDIEVIARIIAQGEDIVHGIKMLMEETKGTFALLILSKDGIYAALSSDARCPFVIGQKNGAVTVASESGGFDNFGFQLIRDLEPGEIILLRDGRWEQKAIISGGPAQFCSFLWVYTTFPNAVIRGIPSSLVRKRLGAALALRDIKAGFIPHIVTPVLFSGNFQAIGYHQEYCRQKMLGVIPWMPFFDELLLRYRFSGRSFLRSEQTKRDREAFIKIQKGGESRADLMRLLNFLADFLGVDLLKIIIAVCEDSIVRGTQLKQNLVPKLKEMVGGGEVHVRASYPEIIGHCPWGKTTKKGELLAEQIPNIGERARYLGADSLAYGTIDDLVQAIGLPREQLCMDCILPSASI